MSTEDIEYEITEALQILRAARVEHEYSPTGENTELVQKYEDELNRLMDRRKAERAATMPSESPAPRSVVSL